MESLKSISELKINLGKVTYDKKSKVLVIELPGFAFIGNYNKNARISAILSDIHKVLEEKGIKLDREELYFFDEKNLQKLHGNTKLKNLMKIKLTSAQPDTKSTPPEVKEETTSKMGKKKSKPKPSKASSRSRKAMAEESVAYDTEDDTTVDLKKREEIIVRDEILSTEKEVAGGFSPEEEGEMEEEFAPEETYKPKKKAFAPKAPPPGAPSPPPPPGGGAPPPPPIAAPVTTSSDFSARKMDDAGPPKEKERMDEEKLDGLIAADESFLSSFSDDDDGLKSTEYNINMGLQYYSVMMEKRSYLFYVYFSHQELKIMDEEGKTVYTTTVKIVTKKKEPPILDLKIEGEDFEIHPLPGRVEVKKDAVNPPVMIFSVMPLKSDRLKKKDESERRFLNVFVHFEGELLSHTILSIIVQPKHFKLKLGPISFNINKGSAIAVSVISILISVLLLGYSIITLDPTSITGVDIVTGFIPQIGSVLFVIIFLYTLVKGVYPLKQQFAGLLNFDSGSGFEK